VGLCICRAEWYKSVDCAFACGELFAEGQNLKWLASNDEGLAMMKNWNAGSHWKECDGSYSLPLSPVHLQAWIGSTYGVGRAHKFGQYVPASFGMNQHKHGTGTLAALIIRTKKLTVVLRFQYTPCNVCAAWAWLDCTTRANYLMGNNFLLPMIPHAKGDLTTGSDVPAKNGSHYFSMGWTLLGFLWHTVNAWRKVLRLLRNRESKICLIQGHF
jgi:hypothetical protein